MWFLFFVGVFRLLVGSLLGLILARLFVFCIWMRLPFLDWFHIWTCVFVLMRFVCLALVGLLIFRVGGIGISV